MNRDIVMGRCRQLAGRARAYWGRLAHRPGQVARGRAVERAGRTQWRHGLARARLARRHARWRTLGDAEWRDRERPLARPETGPASAAPATSSRG